MMGCTHALLFSHENADVTSFILCAKVVAASRYTFSPVALYSHAGIGVGVDV